MRLKPAATSVLLAFVLTSAAWLLVQEIRSPSAQPCPAPPAEGLVVYYFDGDFHCRTCDSFETFTREVLQSDFASELRQGRLQWQVVNVDRPPERHFVRDYALISRTIVLATFHQGRQVRWRKLDRIWDLVDDQRRFKQYIRDETRIELDADK